MKKVALKEQIFVDAKIIYREIVGNEECPRHEICLKRGVKRCPECKEKAYKAISGIIEKHIRKIVKESLK